MTTRQGWLLLLLVLWLATGLRFYRLDAQSFWNDEGNSARLSERALPLIIAGTASDIHPPLYYLGLAAWRDVAGAHPFGLRSFSAFAGILTVAATAALARRWTRGAPGSRATAWLAGLLAAVSPALVYYSQEARMYSLLALLSVLGTLLFLGWRARPTARRATAYSVVTAAGLYTHYFFPAVLVAHLLFALVTLPRRRWPAFGAAWLAATLLYAPWLPIFLRQAGGRPVAAPPLGEYLATAARWLVAGETLAAETALFGVVLAGGLLLLALWRGAALPLAAVAVPLLLMAVAGATRPAFLKFLVIAVPPLAVAIALAVAQAKRPAARLLAAALVLPLLGVMALSLRGLYFVPAYARADYRAMAARVAADERRAAVVLDAPNQWEVFTYYYPAADDVYPLPLGAADPAQIDATLSQVAADYDRIYAIFWGEAERDPERLVERWLDEHAFKAVDTWYGDVRFVTYALPPDASTPVTPLNVAMGEAIVLEGVALGARVVAAGEIVPLTLLWRTQQPLAERYKVFLHLIGQDGRLAAQRDAEPGGGLAPTTTWLPGETVRDNHGLLIPPDLPPGTYELHVGLYDLFDPTRRLSIVDGIDNAFLLGRITINREQGTGK